MENVLFYSFPSIFGIDWGIAYTSLQFWFVRILPHPSQVNIQEYTFFKVDYTLFLNLIFLMISGYLVYLGFFKKKDVMSKMGEMAPKSKVLEKVMTYAAYVCYSWLIGGLMVKFWIPS